MSATGAVLSDNRVLILCSLVTATLAASFQDYTVTTYTVSATIESIPLDRLIIDHVHRAMPRLPSRLIHNSIRPLSSTRVSRRFSYQAPAELPQHLPSYHIALLRRSVCILIYPLALESHVFHLSQVADAYGRLSPTLFGVMLMFIIIRDAMIAVRSAVSTFYYDAHGDVNHFRAVKMFKHTLERT